MSNILEEVMRQGKKAVKWGVDLVKEELERIIKENLIELLGHALSLTIDWFLSSL